MRPALPLLLATCLAAAACGRPLAPNERAFLEALAGDELSGPGFRLHDSLAAGAPRNVPVPPRLTCQARLWPPRQAPTVQVQNAAMAIFEHVYLRPDLYREDLLDGWPQTLPLAEAMLLAHEAVHAWQWRNRQITGYHPLRAALEHAGSPDPYLFDLAASADFLDYGYEQQGAIMEEYVCCRSLAPEAPRTARLHALLDPHFPLPPLSEPLTPRVALPWDGAETEGICDG
jgi:hypothetical protein